MVHSADLFLTPPQVRRCRWHQIRTVYFLSSILTTHARKTGDKRIQHVTDAINISEPVEVSRMSQHCEPYQTFLVRALILQAITPCTKKAV